MGVVARRLLISKVLARHIEDAFVSEPDESYVSDRSSGFWHLIIILGLLIFLIMFLF